MALTAMMTIRCWRASWGDVGTTFGIDRDFGGQSSHSLSLLLQIASNIMGP